MNVRRVYVEKREAYATEATQLTKDLRNNVGLDGLEKVRLFNRYDVEGITDTAWEEACRSIFSEPQVDLVYPETLPIESGAQMLAIELLPGQYDQRADSAAQCVQILTQQQRPEIDTARIYLFYGSIGNDGLDRIRRYLINPIESREASLEKPESLQQVMPPPEPVPLIHGFISSEKPENHATIQSLGLAMSAQDLAFCQEYFHKTENRDPSVTEMKVIDTYWSDHCRHTTFLTEISHARFEEGLLNEPVQEAWNTYMHARKTLYGNRASEKPACLMDLAVIAMKEMRSQGLLDDVEESEEINACSIIVPVLMDDREEEWLVMFKNETHNHPTEIEPFGGAATCLGGAIRDPLSGRSYVYQAMRITGCGNPLTPMSQTLPGKLPQIRITQDASAGYSSYGNQVGVATGYVREYYHDRFVAKRMELGAVIGATPRNRVTRQTPAPGDVILLVGGQTGRDGCGGATGSSVEHDETSLYTRGAEVQKGNAPTERKIQRLFRHEKASKMIKKCNDFGAGGIAVAIGELADGLSILLDKVPKKYEGLDGTELAISESQERMAVVVDPSDAEAFIRIAEKENLEAVQVAQVTDCRRLVMEWNGQSIVDISRDFLDTNGVRQQTTVSVDLPDEIESPLLQVKRTEELSMNDKNEETFFDIWIDHIRQLHVCSQKGLIDKFDSTVGAGTVLMPLGGKYQLTPAEGMAAKLPVTHEDTVTVTGMAAGYNPDIACWSPFHGAYYAVIESLSRLTAMGFSIAHARLSFQEYFEKPGENPSRWGKPLAALLGAYHLQKSLGIPAIGGKDSMSGTYKDLDVPPTLVSFAVAIGSIDCICSPEFKSTDHPVVWLRAPIDEYQLIDTHIFKSLCRHIQQMIAAKKIIAAKTTGPGGIAGALTEMCMGNFVGFQFSPDVEPTSLPLFVPAHGGFIVEMADQAACADLVRLFDGKPIGKTVSEPVIRLGSSQATLNGLKSAWTETLEPVFPTYASTATTLVPNSLYSAPSKKRYPSITGKPTVVIPAFPGTNCEVDSARAFEKAGALTETLVFRNLTSGMIEESVEALAAAINRSQILMLPGGFSAGDEPDGSGKFITVIFRNPRLQQAVHDLLSRRDGLILGICNGFQALVKLGLVPYGEIRQPDAQSPTLAVNTIGRHVSGLVTTRISSTLSPWFSAMSPGDVHVLPVSHGEGRFVAREEDLQRWFAAGQVAAQYVDETGMPRMSINANPNGSMAAVEALTSPDGRVLGKMAHSERWHNGLYQNVPGDKDQKIFESGVAYFR